MKLTISIELDNAAFEEDRLGELERLFQNIHERLPIDGPTHGQINLYDLNGNRVGAAEITEDAPTR